MSVLRLEKWMFLFTCCVIFLCVYIVFNLKNTQHLLLLWMLCMHHVHDTLSNTHTHTHPSVLTLRLTYSHNWRKRRNYFQNYCVLWIFHPFELLPWIKYNRRTMTRTRAHTTKYHSRITCSPMFRILHMRKERERKNLYLEFSGKTTTHNHFFLNLHFFILGWHWDLNLNAILCGYDFNKSFEWNGTNCIHA